MRRTQALLLVSGLLALSAAPVEASTRTVIGIGQGWPEAVTLEVGSQSIVIEAKTGGGGVTSVMLDEPTIVRVRRLSDCQPIVRFVAEPGGRYRMGVTASGRPYVHDLTGQGMDAGPGFDLKAGLTCPPLPDTSTAGPSRPPTTPTPALLLAAVALTIGALGWRLRGPSVDR